MHRGTSGLCVTCLSFIMLGEKVGVYPFMHYLDEEIFSCSMCMHALQAVYAIYQHIIILWKTNSWYTTSYCFTIYTGQPCDELKEGHALAITLGDLLSFDKDLLRNLDRRPAALNYL